MSVWLRKSVIRMAKWIPTKKTVVMEKGNRKMKALHFWRPLGNNQVSFRPLAPVLDQAGMNTFQKRSLS